MRTLFYLSLSFCLIAPSAFAAAAEPERAPVPAESKFESETAVPDFRETLFVVETDEDSASDSLNRISGDMDRGYTSPEQSYRSENHQPVRGAFQQSEDKASRYAN